MSWSLDEEGSGSCLPPLLSHPEDSGAREGLLARPIPAVGTGEQGHRLVTFPAASFLGFDVGVPAPSLAFMSQRGQQEPKHSDREETAVLRASSVSGPPCLGPSAGQAWAVDGIPRCQRPCQARFKSPSSMQPPGAMWE